MIAVPSVLKPDMKAVVWLVIGALVVPRALKMIKR